MRPGRGLLGKEYSRKLAIEYVTFDHGRNALKTRRRASQPMTATPVISYDIREVPNYSFLEGGRYIGMPPATLRYWVLGHPSSHREGSVAFEPLIRAPAGANGRISFNNLVEAHVLRALRTVHGVTMTAVRNAVTYAEKALEIDRLMLSDELRASGRDVFLDRIGELINLSRSGQLALRQLLADSLKRVERDAHALPIRLYPFLPPGRPKDERAIVIDPQVSFGRPTVAGSGISTVALVDRIDAGETVEDLAKDYGLQVAQIGDAVLYERAA